MMVSSCSATAEDQPLDVAGRHQRPNDARRRHMVLRRLPVLRALCERMGLRGQIDNVTDEQVDPFLRE